MEISKKELERILEKQAKKVETRTKHFLKELQHALDEKTERYVGALKEDFGHKIETVFEYVKDIPAIKEKLEILEQKHDNLQDKVDIIEKVRL